MLQGNTGLTCHGVGGRVDFTNLNKARQRQHDLIVMRRLTANQSGVAALRHDWSAGRIGELEKLCDFGDGTGTQHHRRAPAIEVAHLEEVRQLRLRIGDCVFLADNSGEASEQGGIGSGVFRGFIEHRGFRRRVLLAAKRWRPSDEHARMRARRFTLARRGGAAQTIVDRLAQPFVRYRHHRNRRRAGAIQRA